jgi:acyl carrier protein
MNRSELLRKIEGLLEVPREEGALTGEEICSDLEGWDSLAVLSFISILDKDLQVVVPAARIYACRRVNDLVELVADRLTA